MVLVRRFGYCELCGRKRSVEYLGLVEREGCVVVVCFPKCKKDS
jgi:hypothetical protein